MSIKAVIQLEMTQLSDHRHTATENLSKTKCVAIFTNHDLSMINGKGTNPIDKKPFDKYFIESKIKDYFYQVRFVSFYNFF